MTKYHYKAEFRWSTEDNVYVARAPELQGVATHGRTLIEAAKHLDEAITLHLESLADDGEEPPVPMSLKNLSGKFALRMPPELHQDLAIRAHLAGLSVNEFLNRLIKNTNDDEVIPRRQLEPQIQSPKAKYKASKKATKRASKKLETVAKRIGPKPKESDRKNFREKKDRKV